MEIDVFIGLVDHRHGVNVYTATSFDGLEKKIALEYVAEEIKKMDNKEVAIEIQKALDSNEFEIAVSTYFEETAGEENYDFHQDKLVIE